MKWIFRKISNTVNKLKSGIVELYKKRSEYYIQFLDLVNPKCDIIYEWGQQKYYTVKYRIRKIWYKYKPLITSYLNRKINLLPYVMFYGGIPLFLSYYISDKLFLRLPYGAIYNLIFLAILVVPVITGISEKLLILFIGCRPIKYMTNDERERLRDADISYLHMILYDLCGVSINFYIDDSMNINAYALGTKSIIVTRGSLYFLNYEELRGLIIHEMGHLRYCHTLAPLIIYSNPYYMLMLLLNIICDAIFKSTRERRTNIFIELVYSILALLTFLYNIVVALFQRIGENQADMFSVELKEQEKLIGALRKISMTELKTNSPSLIERLQASHPSIYKRIAKLEKEIV